MGKSMQQELSRAGVFVIVLVLLIPPALAWTDGINDYTLHEFDTRDDAVGSVMHPIILYPIQDAMVDSAPRHRDKNFGHAFTLGISVGPMSHEITRSYIQFDLSSIPSGSTIVSATLRLFLREANRWGFRPYDEKRHIQVYRVESKWDEYTITWDVQPTSSVNPSASCWVETKTSSKWIEWDVTSDVQQYVNGAYFFGWMMRLQREYTGTWRTYIYSFNSKEIIFNKPELVIMYSGAPPTNVIVNITQPESGWIYLGGVPWQRMSFSIPIPFAVLIGDGITIKAFAYAPTGVDRVEFYMTDLYNRTQSFTDYTSPYEWYWSGSPNLYILIARAYDNGGAVAEDVMFILKLI